MTPEETDDLLAVADELLPPPPPRPREGYYYLHENGSVHWKPSHVVDYGLPNAVDRIALATEYFLSPFVQYWWEVYCDAEGKMVRTPNFYPQV